MEALLLGIIVVLLSAVLASRYLFRRFRSRNFFYYQVLSILIVATLAVLFRRSFSPELSAEVRPFILLAMGWLGLYSGLFIGLQEFRRFRFSTWIYSISDTLLVFSLYFFMSFSFLYMLTSSSYHAGIGSAVLALGAIEISPLAVSTLRHLQLKDSSFGVFLQSLAGMSGIMTILLMGLLAPMTHAQNLLQFGGSLLLQISMSIVLGLVAVFAIHDLKHSRDFIIWIIGILMIGSGLAMAFSFNAIFVNMIIGMTVSTFSMRRDTAKKLLEPLEKPVFLFLLLFAGLNMQVNGWFILFATVMILFRLMMKYFSFKYFYGTATATAPAVRELAPAIIPFGNLSFTVGIYLLMVVPGEFSSWILGALFAQYIFGFSIAGFAVRNKEQGS